MSYLITAFIGAFLLFLIQPMVGKAILPSFGGSFMTWTIALAFFQGALLIGYLTIHKTFGKKVEKNRIYAFLCFLIISTFFSKIDLASLSSVSTSYGFVFRELWLLLRYIGIPFIALSTCSLFIQRWWQVDSRNLGKEPYFLYGASNLGSFLGLLSYPFIFEPRLPLETLWQYWHYGYMLWVFCVFLTVPRKIVKEITLEPTEEEQTVRPISWLIPAAAGTALLAAVTNVITLDIAAFPFLWVLPLAIYLLTWVKVFSKNPPNLSWWSDHAVNFLTFSFFIALLIQYEFSFDATLKTILLLISLYTGCMLCQSVLLARRPFSANKLTSFYFYISLGGVLGTALVAFVIPMMFSVLAEFSLAVFLVAWAVSPTPPWKPDKSDTFLIIRIIGIIIIVFVLPLVSLRIIRDLPALIFTTSAGCAVYIFSVLRQTHKHGRNYATIALFIALSLVLSDQFSSEGTKIFALRNFYGIYQVFDLKNIRYLQMGTTYHGHEMLKGPFKGQPLFYYHKQTPIGQFMNDDHGGSQKVAILGLGAGVLAAFGKEGQNYDFFELDPDNIQIAQKYFSYLNNSKAKISTIPGDGRLSLRKVASNTYDLIVLDAFSSDSVPIHLLTVDAIAEYMKPLKDNGILLFHVSNRHLNLTPMFIAAANDLGLDIRMAQNKLSEHPYIYPTRWIAIGNKSGIERHLSNAPNWKYPEGFKTVKAWTDNHSSFLSVYPPDISLMENEPIQKPIKKTESPK